MAHALEEQGAAATGIRTNLLVSGGGAGARVTAIASEVPKGRVLVPARRRRVIAATLEPETRMGGRSLLAGGQRAAVGPATRHGERQCSWCRYYFAVPLDATEPRCPDCVAFGSRPASADPT